jgi:hypothetical protein
LKTKGHPRSEALRTILLILVPAFLIIGSVQVVSSQASNTTVAVVPSSNITHIGAIVTVNITISNVQNLYGVDVTLDWNASALQILTATPQLGIESHPGGVLHGDAFIEEDNQTQAIGEYHLVATSQNPAIGFYGSGTIAVVSFNVTGIGHSTLSLSSQLADYNPSGSSFIQHSEVNATVDSAIPEYPSLIILVLLILFASAVTIVYRKLPRKPFLN